MNYILVKYIVNILAIISLGYWNEMRIELRKKLKKMDKDRLKMFQYRYD